MKYTKKPVTIEAWPYEDTDKCRAMLREQGAEITPEPLAGHWVIHTLEGTYQLNVGWYVIKGVRGEFYPCEAAIFAETYDPVLEDEPQSTIVRSHYDLPGRSDTPRSQYDL